MLLYTHTLLITSCMLFKQLAEHYLAVNETLIEPRAQPI